MAGNQFLTEVDLEFNGNFDEIAAQAQAALAKISRAAQDAEEKGGSSRGLGTAAKTVRESAVAAGRAAGFDPAQIRQLGSIFSDFQKSVRDLARTTAINGTRNVSGNGGEVTNLQEAKRNIQQFVEDETRARRRNAAGSAALANSPRFLRADTEAQTRGAILNAAKTQSLNNPRTVGAFVEQGTQSNQLAAELDKAKLGSTAYTESVVRAGQEANLLASVIAEAKSADEDYVSSVVLAATAAKQEAAAKDEALAVDQDYISALRVSIAASKARAAAEAEAATSQRNVNSDARKQVAASRAKSNVAAEVNRLTTPEDLEAQGATQAADARQKLAVSTAALNAKTQEDTAAEAKLILLKRKQAEALAAQIDTLSGRDAGIFKRLLHASHPNGGGGGGFGGGGARTAADEPSFGQYIGNHAVRTLGYAIPGIAIGIGFTELEKSVKAAEQAQLAMRELQAEFEGLGQSTQFAGFASSVKDIASQTGVAVAEVTDLGIAMKGVFGSTQQATIATQGIAQATVTLGVGLQEAQQDLTGITQGFDNLKSQGGGALVSVQNELLHLQDLTGVTAKEQAPGLADVASTANSVGFTSNQSAAIIAAAAQHSGLSTQTIGQTFSKIITSLSSNPQLLGSTEQVLQATTGSGVTANVATLPLNQQIQQVMAGLPHLGGAEYQSVLSNLGINASALPAANALFSTGDQAKQLANSPAPANRAQQEFNKQMDTLAGRSKQLSADFVNLGVAILNSGFGKAFTDFVYVLGLGVKGLTDLNHATGGLVSVAAGAGAAFLGYKALTAMWAGVTLVTDALKGMAVATAIDTAAEETNAGVKGGGGLVGGLLNSGKGGLGAGVGAIGESGLAIPLAVTAGLGAYALHQALRNDGNFNYGPNGPLVGLGSYSPPTTGQPPVPQKPKPPDPHAGMVQLPGGGWVPRDLGGPPPPKKPDPHAGLVDTGLLGWIPKKGDLGQAGQVAGSPGFAESVDKLAIAAGTPQEKHQAQIDLYLRNLAQAKKAQVTTYLHASAAEVIEKTDIAGLQTAFAAGDTSLQTYVSALQTNAALLEQAFQSNPSTASYEAAQQAQLQINQVLDQQAQQAQQFFQSTQQQGNPQADIATIKSLSTETLKTPQARLTRAQQIVSAYQQELQDEASLATSTAQRNAILQKGIQVSSADLATINKDRAANGLTPLSSLNVPGQQITPQQQFQASQEGIQATQALSTANAFEDPVKIAQAALASATQQSQAYLSSGGKATDPAYIQLQAQAKDASNQLTDAVNSVASGQIGLLKAQDTATGNVVSQAKDDQAAAQQAYAAAHGQAQQLAALAQQVAADRSLVTAMNEIATAQAGLLTAMANATGDPRQIIAAAQNAAKTDLANAQRIAAADQALGKNPNQDLAFTAAMTQYYNDRATAANAIAQQTIQSNETLLFLGKETASTAIRNLEAALPQVKGDIAATNQILTEIRQIQNSAGANLSFNIPTTLLAQPTLYQAERLNQAGSGNYFNGNGAPGNNVQVTIQISNPSQTPGAINQLIQAIGGPPVGSISGATL